MAADPVVRGGSDQAVGGGDGPGDPGGSRAPGCGARIHYRPIVPRSAPDDIVAVGQGGDGTTDLVARSGSDQAVGGGDDPGDPGGSRPPGYGASIHDGPIVPVLALDDIIAARQGCNALPAKPVVRRGPRKRRDQGAGGPVEQVDRPGVRGGDGVGIGGDHHIAAGEGKDVGPEIAVRGRAGIDQLELGIDPTRRVDDDGLGVEQDLPADASVGQSAQVDLALGRDLDQAGTHGPGPAPDLRPARGPVDHRAAMAGIVRGRRDLRARGRHHLQGMAKVAQAPEVPADADATAQAAIGREAGLVQGDPVAQGRDRPADAARRRGRPGPGGVEAGPAIDREASAPPGPGRRQGAGGGLDVAAACGDRDLAAVTRRPGGVEGSGIVDRAAVDADLAALAARGLYRSLVEHQPA